MNKLMDIKRQPVIKGRGIGKGGGDGPVETADSLFSNQKARILDLISEGEIVGLGAEPFKNVFIDGTPIQNSDNSYNYFGVKLWERTGTQTQTHIPGIPSVENTIAVGIEVKFNLPHTETVADSTVDDVRVTLSVPSLAFTDHDTGDITGTSVRITIEVDVDGGGFNLVVDDTISGKSANGLAKDYKVPLPAGTTRQVRLNRLTADATSALLQNKTIFQSITTIKNEKLTYPNSALVGISMDSSQFSQIPRRGYKVKGIKVQIPSNYNPITRVYFPSVWDGTFVTDWTDNPAWIFYDLATNTRYGLGQFITPALINKWDLFAIGQYCDTMVGDGFGGTEPRFTCNTQIQNAKDAYTLLVELASVFRGMPYWAGGQLTAVQDSPANSIALFNAANVEDGDFNYSGSAISARHTVALVTWNDPNNQYKQEVEYVENPAGVERYGVRGKQIVAIGATSRGQAHRVGLWSLYSEVNETETVQFVTGYEATKLFAGALIDIQDPNKTAKDFGGRVSFGNVGIKLVEESFDPDPNWTEVGGAAVNANGEMVTNVISGVDSYAHTSFTSQTEVWLDTEFVIESMDIPSGEASIAGFDLTNNIRFDIIFSGGAPKFRAQAAEDVGFVGTTIVTVLPEIGKRYRLKIHAKTATDASSNDGIMQVWLDNVLEVDVTNLDNTTKPMAAVWLGGLSSSAGTNLKLRHNFARVSSHIIDQNFHDVPWTFFNGATEIEKEIICPVVGSAGGHAEYNFVDEDEVWAEGEFSIDEGAVLTTGEIVRFFTILHKGTGEQTSIQIWDNAGTGFFRLTTYDDAGPITVAPGIEFELGRTYKVKIHYKKATTTISDDGIVQVWLDDALIWDLQTQDNNSLPAIELEVGSLFGGHPSANLIIRATRIKCAIVGSGVETDTIPLDLPVTLESGKTYSLSVIQPDGTVENQSVSNTVPGTYEVLTVSTPFTTLPLLQSVWVLESDIEIPTQWKILSVVEGEGMKREVMAVSHDSTKFSQIESGIILTTKPTDIRLGTISSPTNVTIDEYLATANGEVITVVRIQWDEVIKAEKYNIRWRRDNENWESIESIQTNYAEIPHALKGIYTVQVTAVDGKGLVSTPTTATGQVKGIDGLELAPNVSGLELFGQGNKTAFVGRDAKFTWRRASNLASFEMGSEPAGGDSGSLDAFFKDFEIRIYDTNDINTRKLLRTEHVTDNFYTYTWEKNVEDAKFRAVPDTSIPYRQFTIEVYQRNINNALSAFPAKLTAQNPAPELPAGIELTKAVYNHFIKYNPPTDPDWIGMVVWRSTSSGFTPGPENRIHKGPDTFLVLEGVPGTTYYYRYATYDAFDEVGLNISAENVVTLSKVDTPDIEAGAITADKIFAASITADKYSELRNSQLLHANDSLDDTNPFEVEFPLSSELVSSAGIRAVRLSFRIKPFRAYSKSALAGGQQTSSAGGAQTSSAGGAQTSFNKGDPLHAHTYTMGPINPLQGTEVRYSGGTFRASGGGTIYIGDHKVTLINSTAGNIVSIDGGTLRASGGGTVTTDTQDGHNHTITLANSTSGKAVRFYNGHMGARADFDGDNQSAAFNSSATGVGTPAHQHDVVDHTHTVANHTHDVVDHTHALVYGIFEEVNSPLITVFVDDGSGYGAAFGAYNSDQLEIPLGNEFNGSGWKAIKFETTLRCRIIATLEIKIDITA